VLNVNVPARIGLLSAAGALQAKAGALLRDFQLRRCRLKQAVRACLRAWRQHVPSPARGGRCATTQWQGAEALNAARAGRVRQQRRRAEGAWPLWTRRRGVLCLLQPSRRVSQIFTEAMVPDIVKMISANLFRAFPPQVRGCARCLGTHMHPRTRTSTCDAHTHMHTCTHAHTCTHTCT
jgi:hypothetical protein